MQRDVRPPGRALGDGPPPVQAALGPREAKAAQSAECQETSSVRAPIVQHSVFVCVYVVVVEKSENAGEEAGEGEYVNLYSSGQSNGELPHSEGERKLKSGYLLKASVLHLIVLCKGLVFSRQRRAVCLPSPMAWLGFIRVTGPEGQFELDHNWALDYLSADRKESPAVRDGHPKDSASLSNAPGKESQDESKRQQKSPEALESSQLEEEVDELSLVDHNEIMARLTLKQEGDDGPDVRGGSGDILLVHATETDRKDLVLYCEAFLTTYRTFISPEELIKKLQYRYPFGMPSTFPPWRRVQKSDSKA
ncbi:UNVERIFIED_CONTAM: hypothetical protein K2H54_047703, partial [Gekko kuhli]